MNPTFSKCYVSTTVTSEDKTIKVEVIKYLKEGTNTFLYRAEVGEVPIIKTMFAREYSALAVAKKYIEQQPKTLLQLLKESKQNPKKKFRVTYEMNEDFIHELIYAGKEDEVKSLMRPPYNAFKENHITNLLIEEI